MNVRRPTPDDAAAVSALMSAMESVLSGVPETALGDVHEEWRTLNLERDAWLVELDGSLAGYGSLTENGEEWLADGYVHPDWFGHGVGRMLVRVTEEEARARAGKPFVRNGVVATDTRARALLESEGYRVGRYYYRMLVELDQAPAPPAWPEGIRPAPFDFERDADAAKAALDEGFAAEWGYVPMQPEEWKRRMRERRPDPDSWIVVRDGDQIAALTMCDWNRLGTGWIAWVTVRPAWRRRGVGLAMLREAFSRFWHRGQRRIALAVDAANPTGATRLYERAGMHVAWSAVLYEKELPRAA